jgi:hypothetical protein
VKAASPALLRVIAMGAFLIYSTVSTDAFPSAVESKHLLCKLNSFGFVYSVIYLDNRYVSASITLHLRRENLASRNRIFSHLRCFNVENLEVSCDAMGKVVKV